ncbi:hypothetical protein RLOC_00008103 [Lonchura striata]|uniref:Uncharacterized protein n=1 Tax=Lonchura striata TaxID=40157 RepID=A0A218V9V0_9PASE|nr:hypothetical protein RLOC_00008103 [Lonchura striata domestica]
MRMVIMKYLLRIHSPKKILRG